MKTRPRIQESAIHSSSGFFLSRGQSSFATIALLLACGACSDGADNDGEGTGGASSEMTGVGGDSGRPEGSGGVSNPGGSTGGSGSGGEPGGNGAGGEGTDNGLCRLDNSLGAERFAQWFPSRDPFYTYDDLCAALDIYPDFANSGDSVVDGREVAAFFAHVAVQSGDLQFVESTVMNQAEFFGRGPMMIANDANYKGAALAIGTNVWNEPDLVGTDGVVSWQTALWFWMDVDGHGLVLATGHASMTSGDGFGMTLNIAHPYECQEGNQQGARHLQYYVRFCESMGIDPGDNLECPEELK